MARQWGGLEFATEGEAVHHRHHHIAHNKIGYAFTGEPQSALPVAGLQYIVAADKQSAQVLTHVCIVVNNEHGGQFVALVAQDHIVLSILNRPSADLVGLTGLSLMEKALIFLLE